MHRARRASETSKQPPATITNLSPLLLNALKLAPPIPNAGGADVRWRTVRDGTAQQERGRKLAPRQCCRPCEAWLRHDAKMLVTPRGRDATRGMAADKPVRSRGAAKAASATNKEKGPPRPAPRLIPSGSKRREALARVLMLTHYLETIQEEQAGAARLSVSSNPRLWRKRGSSNAAAA